MRLSAREIFGSLKTDLFLGGEEDDDAAVRNTFGPELFMQDAERFDNLSYGAVQIGIMMRF